MKKIVHIVDSMERGGQEAFILDLTSEQKKMGFDTSVICLYQKGILAEKAESIGIKLISLDGIRLSKKQIIRLLSQHLLKNKYDAIHTHNRQPLFFSILAAPSLRSKIVNTRHGNGVRGIYWTLAALFCKKIVNVSADLFEQSNWINRVLLKHKNEVIKNGINIQKAISTGANIGNLIIVGRLNPVKNHKLALNILKKCLDRGMHVKLTIVGDGQERKTVETEIERLNLQNNVDLLGDRSDVNQLLLNADIFLLTSFSEGHSIALLEASGAGLPSIVTNVGGNAEIVQQNITGWSININDVDMFVDKIQTLINDRDLRYQMSKQAKVWVLNNASITSCAKQYENIYFKP